LQIFRSGHALTKHLTLVLLFGVYDHIADYPDEGGDLWRCVSDIIIVRFVILKNSWPGEIVDTCE
jgi:hypothetical protein